MPIHSANSNLKAYSSGSSGDGLGIRVAKLESDVEHIRRTLDEMKIDMRELRNKQERDFRLLFGTLIVAAIGLAGLMAKGFGWIH